jgi:SAM-dependent methyltransferase
MNVYPALEQHQESKEKYAPAASGKETGAIVRCTRCDVVYKDPFPKPETLKEGYEESIDENYLALLPERSATFTRVLSVIERELQTRTEGVSARKKPRLLDIGCAEGTLLALAKKRGFEVMGVEPNKHFVRWAWKNKKLKILQGSVYNKHLRKNYYDAIALLDVIEHVHNPRDFLERCFELLAPGGILFVSTPDFGSLIARAMRRRWFYILSIHVFYFTKKTMSALLHAAGFPEVKSEPYLLRTRLAYITEKSKNYLGPLGSAMQFLIRALGLEEREMTYWLGQRMFIAEKKY